MHLKGIRKISTGIINPLDPLRYSGHDFIGNGTYALGKLFNPRAFTEHDNLITHLHRQSADVYHTHIHTDFPHRRHQGPSNHHLTDAIAQTPVVTVGISDPDHRNGSTT